jgi:hypothetical protein
MYYDDEARRFNFASGLVLGAVLGTGLALLAIPRERLRKPKRLRASARSLKRAAGARLDKVPDSLSSLGIAAHRRFR